MTPRRLSALVPMALYALAGMGATPLHGQQTVAAAPAPSATDGDVLLARRVSVVLGGVTIRQAITTLAGKAGVKIQYEANAIDAYPQLVTLHVVDVPLGSALEMALTGTRLRVIVLPGPHLAVVESMDRTLAANGEITGRVTDAKTKRPVSGAQVTLDDSGHVVRTDESGRFRFANVATGTHRITVRSVGYARQSRMVTVADGQALAMDVGLESSVNTLDQVVVTATGAQRYRELGHVVAQINADSLVREAPITSLSELLTARVPGLAVYNGNGGVVGGDVALRLRGQTTASLDPQPIVIVDGVRYRNTSRTQDVVSSGAGATRPYNAEPRSPLNDLNVNDIETVDVVKGPSASTLYGPDAANGVIVITTKRGKAGKPVWHVYAYPDLSLAPKTDATASPGYRAWGHNANTGQLFNGNCTLIKQLSSCVLDSITVVPTITNDPNYGIFAKSRPQWHSGANVSGGVSALTYFFSGNYDSEVGTLQISPFAAHALKAQLGAATLSDAIRNPNSQQTLTLHTDVNAQVNSFSTLGLVASYTRATQRAINIGALWDNTWSQGVLPANVDTTNAAQVAGYLPVNAFVQSTEEQVNRIVAAGHGAMQPWPWLTVNATIGTDLGSTIDRGVIPSGVPTATETGSANDFRREYTGRSADLGVTAVWHPRSLSFRSSIGAQYTYELLDGLIASANTLLPGSNSIGAAASTGIGQEWAETATLGTYGEEVVGFNDRLFLTGSLRLDGATTLGDAYHPRPFPKVGASWIVSDEPFLQRLHVPGLDELRLRYSFGASSRYPTSAMKNGNVGLRYSFINGQNILGFDRSILANPLIRPERTQEAEWGADLTLAANTHVGLTWYRRTTRDQLNTLTVPYQFDSQWANVGDLAAHGFEATLDTKFFESRMATVQVGASYSYNTNKVLSLGSATGVQNIIYSLVAGAPLDASFGTSIVSFADTAGGHADGIIQASEVTRSPVHYLGVFYAPNVYTVTPSVLLFGAHIRVSALFDRQTGGVQIDPIGPQCGDRGTCVAAYLKTTPLDVQARLFGNAGASQLASSDFTRWRELAITGEVPQSVRSKLWLSRASVSLQVRNLWLWTRYHGPDPESVPGLGTIGLGSAASGAKGIPQPRSWALRFDVSP